jgi:hypothetical protein
MENHAVRTLWSRMFQRFSNVKTMSIICHDQLFEETKTLVSIIPEILGDTSNSLKLVECWSSPCRIQVGPTLDVTDVIYHSDTRVRYVFSRNLSNEWTLLPEDTPMASADNFMTIGLCTDCGRND